MTDKKPGGTIPPGFLFDHLIFDAGTYDALLFCCAACNAGPSPD